MASPHTIKALDQRANLYHQIGTSLAAGIPLAESLQFLVDQAPGTDRVSLAATAERLRKGSSLTEALSRSGGPQPAFDIALLAAAEQSGHLDAACKRLGDHYAERAKLARQVRGQLIYPAILLHMAVLVFPNSELTALVMEGSVGSFVLAKLLVLAPIYAGAYLVVRLLRGEGSFAWRLILDRALAHVPVFGSARRNLALASLCAALEGLVRAGVSMGRAWETAAAASGSPALEDGVSTWRPVIEAGRAPSELLQESPKFPRTFTKLYRTGEVSGALDETLKRLQRLYREEGSRQLQIAAEWAPRILYIGIVLAIAAQVISFYSGFNARLEGL
jgi:type II secretory pathway component PulF